MRLTRTVGRLLRVRWLMRAPIRLYRMGLGVLLGPRLVMLEHVGRSSGAPRHVVLEVFDRPEPGTILVVSGFGPRAQWYRNIRVNPSTRVWNGRLRAVPARAEVAPDAVADAALDRYAAQHPAAWRRLRPVVEEARGRAVERGADLSVVALRLDPSALQRPGSAGSTA